MHLLALLRYILPLGIIFFIGWLLIRLRKKRTDTNTEQSLFLYLKDLKQGFYTSVTVSLSDGVFISRLRSEKSSKTFIVQIDKEQIVGSPLINDRRCEIYTRGGQFFIRST